MTIGAVESYGPNSQKVDLYKNKPFNTMDINSLLNSSNSPRPGNAPGAGSVAGAGPVAGPAGAGPAGAGPATAPAGTGSAVATTSAGTAATTSAGTAAPDAAAGNTAYREEAYRRFLAWKTTDPATRSGLPVGDPFLHLYTDQLRAEFEARRTASQQSGSAGQPLRNPREAFEQRLRVDIRNPRAAFQQLLERENDELERLRVELERDRTPSPERQDLERSLAELSGRQQSGQPLRNSSQTTQQLGSSNQPRNNTSVAEDTNNRNIR